MTVILPPPGDGTEGLGPQGAATPPGPKSFEEIMAGLMSITAGTTESEAISKLHEFTDTLATEGLTNEEIAQLQARAAQTLIDFPALEPADKVLVTMFQARLLRITIDRTREGMKTGGIPVAEGNAFLTGTTMPLLFQILTKISALESKIKLEESKLKIALAIVLIETAEEIASLIIEMGNVAAEKCINTAMQYMTEGYMAICQAVISATTIAMTAISLKKTVDDQTKARAKELFEKNPTEYLKNDKGVVVGEKDAVGKYPMPAADTAGYKKLMQEAKPSASEMITIQNMVDTEVRNWSTIFSSTISGVEKFIKAGLEFDKAYLDRINSLLEATKSQLQTLLEMINKTGDALAKDVDEMNSAMQKLSQILEEIARVYGQMGGGRAA